MSSLEVEVLEDRILLSAVQIFAAGDMGDESFSVQINQATVRSYSLSGTQIESFTYNNPSLDFVADDVRIQFTNDSFDPVAGIDRNLRIDRIVIDGTTYQTEHSSVFSTGTWTAADGIVPGFRQSETLHGGGYFQYAGGSIVDPPSGSNVITVFASGDVGRERMEVSVNGSVVGAQRTVTTNQRAYNYTVADGLDVNSIRIRFTNDEWDPVAGVDSNLTVDRIVVNGQTVQTESDDVLSTGTWRPADGIVPGRGRGQTLHAAGYFDFPIRGANVFTNDAEMNQFLTTLQQAGVSNSTLDQMVQRFEMSRASFNGNSSANEMLGDNRNETFNANGGNDRIFAASGSDLIRGGSGNDQLFGERGNDVLMGGGGRDELRGGDGNDILLGGDGVDIVDGEGGTDYVSGGAGNDIFRFIADDGTIVITDYDRLRERIELINVDRPDISLGTDLGSLSINHPNGLKIILLGVAPDVPLSQLSLAFVTSDQQTMFVA